VKIILVGSHIEKRWRRLLYLTLHLFPRPKSLVPVDMRASAVDEKRRKVKRKILGFGREEGSAASTTRD
jgi:hypothetical protein